MLNSDLVNILSKYLTQYFNFSRNRQLRLPPMPRARENIELSADWCQTLNGERFLLVDDGTTEKLIIFASDDMIKELCNSDTIYMDGTFKTCPRLFNRLFTINLFVHEQQFHVCMAFCQLKQS